MAETILARSIPRTIQTRRFMLSRPDWDGGLAALRGAALCTVRKYRSGNLGREIGRIRAEPGLEDRFVAIYAGLHGFAQGLKTILQTAGTIAADHFLMVGEGPGKDRLLDMKAGYGLTKVTFAGKKRRKEMADWPSAADAAGSAARRGSRSPDPRTRPTHSPALHQTRRAEPVKPTSI